MARANEIAQRCRSVLESHYGPRFKGLILYGSVEITQSISKPTSQAISLMRRRSRKGEKSAKAILAQTPNM